MAKKDILPTPDETRASWLASLKPEVIEGASAMSRSMQPAGEATEAAVPSELTPEMLQRLEVQDDIGRKATALAENMAAQQFECAKAIGQMQAFQVFRDFAAVGNLAMIQRIKDTKTYKGLSVPMPDGTKRTVNTFEGFCEFLGMSYRKVAEDLQNLSVFGESFLDSAKQAGLGYRDLRKLRSLPEGDREIIIDNESLRNDPELLLDKLEEVIGQRKKEKAELNEARSTLKARDTLLDDKTKALDAAQTELIKLKSLGVDEKATLDAAKQQEALIAVAGDAGVALGGMVKFFVTLNAALELEGLSLHVREHLEGASHAVAMGCGYVRQ
jgi:hypothetical protein